MDQIRDRIRQRMSALSLSKRSLSLKLGRGATYMHDYLEEDAPRDLPYETKLALAEILGMPPRELGIVPHRETSPPARAGFSEDAEAYLPPANHYLAATQHVAFFRMRSRALDEHPERIRPGDILAFNLNLVIAADIASGTIVVAQLYDKKDLAKTHGTVIRQFIAPNKLITNSSDGNEMISLDDSSTPFEAVIKGAFLSVIRETH